MQIYDVIGIGFGPSNLALAVALEENQTQTDSLSYLFLEQKSSFAWQPGMLLPDTKMQINFLKDLVTLRNPQSKYTFVNYLKEAKRLNDFINMKIFFPTRAEFNDYLSWVANHFGSRVRYGSEVIDIQPLSEYGQEIILLQIQIKDIETGETYIYYTRNIVLAAGGVPTMPAALAGMHSPNITHSHHFTKWIGEQKRDREQQHYFIVAGSGQSAAEVIYYLYQEYPNAQITSTIRKSSYKPADDSPFVNEVFFPEVVDFMHNLAADKRRQYLNEHSSTNYAVVDLELIEKLYEVNYTEKVTGRNRLRILPFKEIVDAREHGDKLTVNYKDLITDQSCELNCDALILATGYNRQFKSPLTAKLSPYLMMNKQDEPIIERDYRVSTLDVFKPLIYAQGYSELTHGISDTLLSVLAVRSQEIIDSLVAKLTEQKKPQYEPQV